MLNLYSKLIKFILIIHSLIQINSQLEPIIIKPFEKFQFNNLKDVLLKFENIIPDNYTSDLPPELLINMELDDHIKLKVDISTAKTLEILFSNETDPLTKNIFHGESKLNQFILKNGSSVNNGSGIYYFYINGTIQKGSFEISNMAQKKFININQPFSFFIKQYKIKISVDYLLFGINNLEKDIMLMYEVEKNENSSFLIYQGNNISVEPYYKNDSEVYYDYVLLKKGSEYTFKFNINENNQRLVLNFLERVIFSLNENENASFRSNGDSHFYFLVNIQNIKLNSNFVLYLDTMILNREIFGIYLNETDINEIEKSVFKYEYKSICDFSNNPLIINKSFNGNSLLLKISFNYLDEIITLYNAGTLNVIKSINYKITVFSNEIKYYQYDMIYHSKISESYLVYCDEENSMSLYRNKILEQKNLFLLSPSKNETIYILLTKSKMNKTLEIKLNNNNDKIIIKESNTFANYDTFSFDINDCSKVNFLSFYSQKQYASFNSINYGDAEVYRINSTNGISLKNLLDGKDMKIMDKVYENFGWQNEYFVIKCTVPSLINFEFTYPTYHPEFIDIKLSSFILFLKEKEYKYLINNSSYQIRLANFKENNSLIVVNNRTGKDITLNKNNIYVNFEDELKNNESEGLKMLKSTEGDCLIYINSKLDKEYEIIDKYDKSYNFSKNLFITFNESLNKSKDIRIRLHSYKLNTPKNFEYFISYGYIPYIGLTTEYKSKQISIYNGNAIIDIKNPFKKGKHELQKDEKFFVFIENDSINNVKIDFIDFIQEVIIEDQQYLFEKTNNNIYRFTINAENYKTFAYQVNQCDSPRFFFKLITDSPGPIIKLSNETSTGFYQVFIYKPTNFYTFEFTTDRNYLFRYKTYKETLDYVFEPTLDYNINITKNESNFIEILFNPYLKNELVHYYVLVGISDEYIKNISDGCFFYENVNNLEKKNNSELDFLIVQFDNKSIDGNPINISINMSMVASNKNYSLNIMAQQIENYHFIEFYKKLDFCYNCNSGDNEEKGILKYIIIIIIIVGVLIAIGVGVYLYVIKRKNHNINEIDDALMDKI